MLIITNRCCLASQLVVGGTENTVVLQNLNSLTEYEIAVFAVYRSSASDALRGNEITRESCRTIDMTPEHLKAYVLHACVFQHDYTVEQQLHKPHVQIILPNVFLLYISITTFL